MKQIWLGAVSTAVLLSGCAPVMYSNQPAPVVSLNPSSQQNIATQPAGSIQANNTSITHAATATPYRPTMPTTQPQSKPDPAPVPVRPAQPRNDEGHTHVAAASPYGKPAVSEPYRGNSDDGWNVSANNQPSRTASNASPSEPVAKRNSDTRSTEESNNSSQPQKTASTEPVRPKARNEAPADSNDTQVSHNETEREEKQVASVAPVKKPNNGKSGNPVSDLLKKASASLGKGDLDGAAAYLENAHRIDPKNAKILYDIANIRYHQGRFKDAESFAGRATNAGGSNSMMKKAWALIANARKSLGDNQGAIAAAEKAASL